MKLLRFGLRAAVFAVGLAPATALAATYEVGPGKPYATIQDTLDRLGPGDVVEVQGDHTYPGDVWLRTSGTKAAPITVRGVAVNGKRPVLQGIGTEEWHDMIVLFYANHLVFEGFEIIGDGNADHGGLVNKGDDVTLRDLVVHGVANQGLLGTDTESGSLTLEASEFYGNGSGLYNHQIYMATDESMYPGSVFRMESCYVHDGAGGNNVKSRAERNEIYYNWIEGAVYHELDLIGPDGQDPSLAREDSDVVGNVLVKHSEWRIARIGGDDTGDSAGRYRFVNNTMILGAAADVAIGLQQSVESVEMHNNVIVRVGATGGSLWDYNEPSGPAPAFSGSNNWIMGGIDQVPASFTGGMSGADPFFQNAAASDFRPSKSSPLIKTGTSDTMTSALELSNPLALPLMVPPSRALGTQAARPEDGTPDVGAFEYGSGTTPGHGGAGTSGGATTGGDPSTGASGSAGRGVDGDAEADAGGCSATGGAGTAAGWSILALALVASRRRTRRRS